MQSDEKDMSPVVFFSKIHNHNLIMRKYQFKPILKGTVQSHQSSPKVSVLKIKERLKNYHRLEETKET